MTQSNSEAVKKTRKTLGGSTSKRKRRRRLVVVAAWTAGLILVGVFVSGWLAVKASTISNELKAAMDTLPRLKDDVLRDDVAAAGRTVDELKAHTANAKEAATDPVWRIAGTLPWAGVNFQAASEVATSADDVARLTAAPIATVFQSLEWKALAPTREGVELKPLVEAEPRIASAAQALRLSSDRLNAIEVDHLLPQVRDPLVKAREELKSLRGGMDAAAHVASTLPEMMGIKTPRKYLLLIQNSAEARATGGIPGALALLTVDSGKLTLGSQTSAAALGSFVPPVSTDPEQELIYSARLGRYMQDVNLTPDFPTSAKLARAMWEKKRGQRVDGVVSVDPVALSYILEATGPVEINDPKILQLANGSLPTDLTASNVVPTLLSRVYSSISEPALQDVYFAGVAKEIFSALSDGTSDTKKLLDGLSRGATEGRILVWSNDVSEQSKISAYPLSGSISGSSGSPARFGVYFNDGTGAKMDYYIKRTAQLVQECTTDGYVHMRVRVTSTNTAPRDAATSLPEYVTGAGGFGVPAGTVQTNIVTYGPVQANVDSVLADGKKISFASQSHSGRPVGMVTVALPPGKSSTIDFLFDKIVQQAEPELSVTPTIQPRKDVVLDTISKSCGPAAEQRH